MNLIRRNDPYSQTCPFNFNSIGLPLRLLELAEKDTARQTDRQTNRHTHRRVGQNHFSRRIEGCTSEIRSYLKLDFLHDANTSIDMEVKMAEIAFLEP